MSTRETNTSPHRLRAEAKLLEPLRVPILSYRIVLYCSRTVEEEEGVQVEGEIGFVTVRFRGVAQRSTGEVFLEGAILD